MNEFYNFLGWLFVTLVCGCAFFGVWVSWNNWTAIIDMNNEIEELRAKLDTKKDEPRRQHDMKPLVASGTLVQCRKCGWVERI